MKYLRCILFALCCAVLAMALPSAASPASWGKTAADTVNAAKVPPLALDSLCEVKTSDGQSISGYLVAQSDSTVTLRLQSGGKVTLERGSIQSMKSQTAMYKSESGKLWRRDGNRTRYLYSPSAMMLKAGEGSFSQKELLFSTFGYGVTDYLNVQVGSAIPFWFAGGGKGFNMILGAKVGAPIADKLSVAGGIQTFIIPDAEGALNLPFGAVTLGDDRAHLTFTASSPFLSHRGDSGFGKLIWLALCGNLRMSEHTALISENWLFKIDEDPGDDMSANTESVLSLAMRVFGEKISVDIGAFFNKHADIPIPWLDFTYNFGA